MEEERRMNFGEWQLISSSDCIVLVLVPMSSDLHVWRTRQTTYFVTKTENIIILEAAFPYPMDPARGRRFALCT